MTSLSRAQNRLVPVRFLLALEIDVTQSMKSTHTSDRLNPEITESLPIIWRMVRRSWAMEQFKKPRLSKKVSFNPLIWEIATITLIEQDFFRIISFKHFQQYSTYFLFKYLVAWIEKNLYLYMNKISYLSVINIRIPVYYCKCVTCMFLLQFVQQSWVFVRIQSKHWLLFAV